LQNKHKAVSSQLYCKLNTSLSAALSSHSWQCSKLATNFLWNYLLISQWHSLLPTLPFKKHSSVLIPAVHWAGYRHSEQCNISIYFQSLILLQIFPAWQK